MRPEQTETIECITAYHGPVQPDVALVCPHPVGTERQAGTALRIRGIASGLKTHGLEAVIIAPNGPVTVDGIDVLRWSELQSRVRTSMVVVPAADVILLPELRDAARLIVDFPGPFPLEAYWRHRRRGDQRGAEMSASAALRAADAVLISQPRQDAYVAHLAGSTLRTLVVPFGSPLETPPIDQPRGGGPARLIWPGGVWPWLDVTPALEIARRGAGQIELEVLGTDAATRASLEGEIDRLGIRDRVHLQPWTTPADFGERLAQADLAVTFDRGEPERGLAFRTRLLHAMWASVPVLAPRGEWVTDAAVAAGAGLCAEADSPDAMASSILAYAGDKDLVLRTRSAARSLAGSMTYGAATAELSDLMKAGIPGRGERSEINRRIRAQIRLRRAF